MRGGRGWRNRRRGLDDRHLDDWLMTYADMITLLLCFFAVFLAIAIPDQKLFEEAKKKMVNQFKGSGTSAENGNSQVGIEGANGPPSSLKGRYPLPAADNDNEPTADQMFVALPSIVDRYRDGQPDGLSNSGVDVQKKGDRITTIEMNSASFFGSGSATLSAEGQSILSAIKPELIKPEYKDYKISVEGYTDDNPIATPQFPSNWELSTARASAVVRALLLLGIEPERLRAVGYAHVSPKSPNRDTEGNPLAENQAENRRVVIRLEKIEQEN